MINLIIGKNGSGKTKKLVELSNQQVEKSSGNVVVIGRDRKLTFDLSHKTRLINIDGYNITNFCELYGFICGICAGNYDVTDVLVDTVFNFDEYVKTELINFIEKLNLICDKSNIKLTLALSLEKSDVPDEIMSLIKVK